MSSPPLALDTVLVRAPDITLTLGDDDLVRIRSNEGDLVVGRIAMTVIDAFIRPRTIADALVAISTNGTDTLVDAPAVVHQLVRAGVLAPPGSHPRERTPGFVRPSIHIDMLDDGARTSAFIDALRTLVTPDDIVIDIGTGTGVLATAAAIAGARRVYAVESTAIAEAAARVIDANGVADKVRVVREHSSNLTLPELGTILVTETIGNDPLDEHILEIVSDARRRLLAPRARVIPARIEIVAVVVEIPTTLFDRHVFTSSHVERYRAAYGIDFEPLLAHRLGRLQPISLATKEGCALKSIAASATLITLDLEGEISTSFSTKTSIALVADAARWGVFLAFRATLAPGIVLSTVPGEVSASSSWRYELWPALDYPEAPRGASFDVQLEYRRGRSSIAFERTS